jgi:arylsulfatase A-like enzyme
MIHRKMLAALLLVLLAPAGLIAAESAAQLPRPDAPFAGVAGQTLATSKPFFAPATRAPAGAPNILIVLTDDTGFGASSTFGGPVPTPSLDRLAREGLSYNRFHTTAMCSPTRAALLTGRNHHAVGSGIVTDTGSGFPGYTGDIPRSAATIAEVLRQHGYNTAMFGKHHNTPNGQLSAAGPFDHWPTGLGFEYFYGFLGGDTNQWHPRLFRGIQRVETPDTIGQDATLDKFLIDDAIDWLHNHIAVAPDKPFLMYAALGTNHSPHQVPAEWIAKFRGKFDMGWDAIRAPILKRQKELRVVPRDTGLTPRPTAIPAWDALSADERRVYARMMEVFAAMLAYQDHQFGRLLDELDRTGVRENTLVLFIEGDNGSSPEGEPDGTMNELGRIANRVPEDLQYKLSMLDQMGGPNTYQLYPVGWGWAMDTPFQWTKQVGSHLGGTRNGFVVSWPSGIGDKGGIRSQFTHVIDIAPTLYEVIGIEPPATVNGIEQQRIDGTSFRYSFGDAKAPERHTTQYFEMLANRAIYHDGWMASTTPARLPWGLGSSGISPADYQWELYNLDRDYAQARNIAASNPAKLAELKALWEAEAERNHVFPLDDTQGGTRSIGSMRPEDVPRPSYVYWGGGISAPASRAPMLGVFPFSVEADVVVPAAGLDGVLAAIGSRFGGWSFHFEAGRPVVVHAYSQQPRHVYRVAADTALPPGRVKLGYAFTPHGKVGEGGTLTISVDGKQVAEGVIEHTAIMTAGLGETFDTGRDTGATVVDYPGSNAFTGEIDRIEVKQTLAAPRR